MATMKEKISAFVELALAAGYSSPLSRSQIKALKAKHSIPMPAWLMKDDMRRCGTGRYSCPELSARIYDASLNGRSAGTVVAAPAATVPAKKVAKTIAVAAPVTVVTPVTVLAARIVPTTDNVVAGASLVPDRDPLYIPFGHFKDLETIIGSARFYPVYVTGLSGNGKTTMIEQVCAKLKRECIRVNITAMTDEDDLLGGFRLIKGETVWQDGPVVLAMKRGAVLLLDEVDLGSDKMMCLQPVLEGKGVYLKKINEKVVPVVGFTCVATANTKGQGGEHSERFAGTRIQNEAFLERFKITLEQEYPTKAQERKIVLALMDNFGCRDEKFADNLTKWSDTIRTSFMNGAVDDMITTRRLCAIVDNFSIFSDKAKAIKQTIARFTSETQEAFLNFYSMIDAEIAAEKKADDVGAAVENRPISIIDTDVLLLVVSYADRLSVKGQGAMWSPLEKCWYITGQLYMQNENFWNKWTPTLRETKVTV